MEKKNQVEFLVSGRYALFSDPLTRAGGEKFSYQVPTYQSLKGILESIYWKPTIMWMVDDVRVMKPIRTESKNIRPIEYSGGNSLSVYTYLADVSYQVRAHFVWNLHRENLEEDRNENKHSSIARRMLERGGRRDVFLGTRECQAYVEPCIFGEGPGFYDGYGVLDLGLMFHGFDYPDETGRDELAVRLWRPRMVDGCIHFLTPDECDRNLCRSIHPMKPKLFGKENFSGVKELGLTDDEGVVGKAVI